MTTVVVAATAFVQNASEKKSSVASGGPMEYA